MSTTIHAATEQFADFNKANVAQAQKIAALALEMALLKATFLLMQPATADRRAPRPDLHRGTQALTRAYARNK